MNPSPLKTALAYECFQEQDNSTLALPSDQKMKTGTSGRQRVQEQVMMTVKRQKSKSSQSSTLSHSNRGRLKACAGALGMRARPAREPGKAPGSPGTCVRSPGGCSSGFPPLKVAARGRRRCQLPVEHSQAEVGKLNGLQAPGPCVLPCWEKGKESGSPVAARPFPPAAPLTCSPFLAWLPY